MALGLCQIVDLDLEKLLICLDCGGGGLLM